MPNLPASTDRLPASEVSQAHAAVTANGQQAFQQCIDHLSAKYHQVVTYQPANRFWAFQTYETLLFVALSAALAGFCVWWVRRRLS